jgi:predicted MFS family arabinose efflux permease
MPHPWRDFREGLSYMRRTPLVLAIGLAQVGWASGGGAAQILFTLFGEVVFGRGPGGVGILWSAAGVGLVIGGITGHRIGERLPFPAYKRTIAVCFVVIGVSYMLFSVMPTIWLATVFILLSRVAMGINNVLNRSVLLTHVPDALRGRVFATMETLLNVTMTGSVAVAGAFVDRVGIREVGVASGALCGLTAVFWMWANAAGRLPEPERAQGPSAPEESAHPA